MLAPLALCVLASNACSQVSSSARYSILEAKGDTIVVLLLDAKSARPMAGVAVEVWSDNGIRCLRDPCPTNGIAWKSNADAAGKIHIPRRVFQSSLSVTADEHFGDLARDAYATPNDGWALDLFPHDSDYVSQRPIKLVDAKSGSAVANRTVRVDYRTALHNRDAITLTSNGLGYIFIPTLGVAGDFEDVWAVAPGYRRTRIDFSGDGAMTRMRRQ